jgi:hypothetical protein
MFMTIVTWLMAGAGLGLVGHHTRMAVLAVRSRRWPCIEGRITGLMVQRKLLRPVLRVTMTNASRERIAMAVQRSRTGRRAGWRHRSRSVGIAL